MKLSAEGRPYVACGAPRCTNRADRLPLDERPGCPECSAAVRDAPSPVRALARLVASGAHRDHARPLSSFGDLPF